jgi:hypothetical protein
MSTFHLFVPGVLSGLGSTWARSFANRTHNPPKVIAIPYSYHAGVLGAAEPFNPGGFDLTVKDVADRLIRGAKECEIVRACGHSHGCMVLLTAMLRNPQIYLDRLTLIAAAVPDDCELSGLNTLAERDQLAELDILYSEKDTVLRDWGSTPGYGQLGLNGPRNVALHLREIITPLLEYQSDHGEYFCPPLVDKVYPFVTR